MASLTIHHLAEKLAVSFEGDGDAQITSPSTLEDAGPGQITFLSNPKYLKLLDTTRASAVIVSPKVETPKRDGLAILRAANPYYAFAQAVILLCGFRKHPHEGIHPKAHVDPTATVGEGSILYPGVFVGPRARIGRDCILYPNAVVYDDCILGDRVTLHANTTIGADGYGYATHQGVHHKIPQVSNVVIEDDVEIHANVTIDRGALTSTFIGRGGKIGDLVTIGHGARVGPYALLVAQAGISGSVTLGHHVTLAGQVGVVGHLRVGDNVVIAAQSGVTNDVPDQSTMLGSPAMPIARTRRVYAIHGNLPELVTRLRKLESMVEELSMKDPETPADPASQS